MDDGGVGLHPSQDERFDQFAQQIGFAQVVLALDGQFIILAELRLLAQIAGIEEIEDRPQVEQTVFHRCAGEGEPVFGFQLQDGLGLCGQGIFDVLRLIQHHPPPADTLEQLGVFARQGVGRDEHIATTAGDREGVFFAGASAAMVDVGAYVRGEALDFLAPVADYRGGRNQQIRRSAETEFLFPHELGNDLDGLAQPHVIGQTAA